MKDTTLRAETQTNTNIWSKLDVFFYIKVEGEDLAQRLIKWEMERANQVQIHASLVFHLNCLFTNVRPRTTQDRELLNDEIYEEEIK